MSKDEFNAWVERYGLTVDKASKVLGTSRANGFKYANGTRPVSKSVAYGAEAIDLLPSEIRTDLIQKRLA
ncbi:hypothetical protein L1264_20670 [Pseudoalteromonas sp. APAL1]|uniref:hypothetical protein n=1 Tax=Pseudoalteromonas sp. APAL1 TaxID=2908883 RepID=UPI001F271174|nr:hypothetical protein [Pseudoalteromonas sp. APAL1]MCF2922876.1 hypothetical protein [Pseudoalteromonas sp. APAL1]